MERKRYSVISNLLYLVKYIHRWDKTALLVYLLNSPMTVVSSLAETYFAPALIAQIEAGRGAGSILGVSAGFTALLIASQFAFSKFMIIAGQKSTENMRRFDLLLSEKIMDMDFELIEGPVGRNKYQKAKNAMEEDGVYGFVGSVFFLFTSAMGFTSFSVIIGTLNPLIILAILASQGLAILTDKFTDNLVDKTKDKRAEIDRHLNYMTKNSRDFLIAKDIRLYNMRALLQHMSEYFIGEKKLWTNKVYLYYFISDIMTLLVSVVIKGGVYAFLIYKTFTSGFAGSEIVLYLTAILGFSDWISQLGASITELYEKNLKVCDLREFMDIQNEMNCGWGEPLPLKMPYSVELKNISFTYPESERQVLDNLNFTLHPGERVALVGRNGAGKTTLVKLLCGLYRPTAGSIFVNGTNISVFNRDEYYTAVSAVFQDARVMPVSIASNVAMKTGEKTNREKVMECLRIAGLAEKIASLEQGIDTPLVKSVNDNAAELSGGELQKLLLARAIYKDAPLLILDEPTAALDPIAENELYMKYSDLSYNRTSVYISHRLSSTRFCDRIVFLDDGRFVEIGTHDELMALGGKYAKMFAIQSKYYAREDSVLEEA
ncbi:MAG: ABC transporter ATP-binding protein/permease [Oscillospiraceae bacterium]|jgi:ABC-type multidrug transport system fused ATPase/permease subunit|nr:ABC transporter ATP-binding protein/permease [Oscillospiraceae bacterium]